jgi:hypothetical protein
MGVDGYNWGLVVSGGNPFKGDPGRTRDLANEYLRLHNSFNTMADSLDRLGTSTGMRGKWNDSFKDKSRALPGDFRQFADGFKSVHRELDAWAGDMQAIQQNAVAALNDAEQANRQKASCADNVRSANGSVSDAARHERSLGDDDTATEAEQRDASNARLRAEQMLQGYQSQLNTAENDFDNAKTKIIGFEREYNEKAEAHAAIIRSAKKQTPEMKWYEKIRYSQGWQVFVKVLEVAAAVLAVAGLFIGGWVIIATAVVATLLLADRFLGFLSGDVSGWQLFVAAFSAGASVCSVSALFSKGSSFTKVLKQKNSARRILDKATSNNKGKVLKRFDDAKKNLWKERFKPTDFAKSLRRVKKQYNSMKNLKYQTKVSALKNSFRLQGGKMGWEAFKTTDFGKILGDVGKLGTGENHLILVSNHVVTVIDDVHGLFARKRGPWPSTFKMLVPVSEKGRQVFVKGNDLMEFVTE